MAVTAFASGTQSASVGTEHTLADVNVAGAFVPIVDLVNMAAGDVVELRVYQIVLTGGTRHVLYKAVRMDAQPTDDTVVSFPPVSNELTDAGSVRFTLKQTRGTGRNFPWKVIQHS